MGYSLKVAALSSFIVAYTPQIQMRWRSVVITPHVRTFLAFSSVGDHLKRAWSTSNACAYRLACNRHRRGSIAWSACGPQRMSMSSAALLANPAAKEICAEVIPVPILSDNYAYLLIDPETDTAACVDPAEPDKVIAAAEERGVKITALLCTHKHWDHSGGNEAMAKKIPGLEIVSSAYEDDVPGMTVALKDQDEYTFGRFTIKAFHTPCHTTGHIVFFVTPTKSSESQRDDLASLVFTGDTLFIGGCGRFFEGNAVQMSTALQGVASRFPPETRVFCGHEYTISNLQFAKAVEPDNAAVVDKLDWSRKILAQGGYTVPSTIAQELRHNPFMRVSEPSVQKATGASDPASVMAILREMKNSFRPPPENSGRFPSL